MCKLALARSGRRAMDDLGWALDIFAHRRGELDMILGYTGTHLWHDFGNASYFFLYCHWYAAAACGYLKKEDEERAPRGLSHSGGVAQGVTRAGHVVGPQTGRRGLRDGDGALGAGGTQMALPPRVRNANRIVEEAQGAEKRVLSTYWLTIIS
ncbi:MAG: hypothetical protein HY716_08650 [Planctomycetes bacterium]|nr:hypothetical protein [Planctomycetota bacterium]